MALGDDKLPFGLLGLCFLLMVGDTGGDLGEVEVVGEDTVAGGVELEGGGCSLVVGELSLLLLLGLMLMLKNFLRKDPLVTDLVSSL